MIETALRRPQATSLISSIISGEFPVILIAGKPRLGVAKLRSCHEFAKSVQGSFAGCWLRAIPAVRTTVAVTVRFIRCPPEVGSCQSPGHSQAIRLRKARSSTLLRCAARLPHFD